MNKKSYRIFMDDPNKKTFKVLDAENWVPVRTGIESYIAAMQVIDELGGEVVMGDVNKVKTEIPTSEEKVSLSRFVRPMITLGWTIIILYCIAKDILVAEWAKTVYMCILGFYFGERSALKDPRNPQDGE